MQKGIALVVVLAMVIVFSIIGTGVLLYTTSIAELSYHQVRKAKAYYAAEAGLQRGLFEANRGMIGGPFNWGLSMGGETISISYTITDNHDRTKTVTSSVSNIEMIKIP